MPSQSILRQSSYSSLQAKKDDAGDGTADTTPPDSAGKETDPGKELRKSVSFDPEIKPTKARTTRRPNPTRSARVGKADPIRDISILAFIMFCFYMVAWQFQDVGKEEDDTIVKESKNKGNALNTLKNLGSSLEMVFEQRDKRFPPRYDCGFFLAPSSIPKTGWGIYAGKNYSAGDQIMESISGPSWIVSSGLEDQRSLQVAPLSLLLKHHPKIANVKPSRNMWAWKDLNVDEAGANEEASASAERISLVASEPIQEGQELLLAWDDHLHSILPSYFENIIPTLEDYEEADELIFEARKTFRESKSRGSASNKQTGIVGQGLQMIQRVVARYRPAVAALMPIALDSLKLYHGRVDQVTSLYLGLRNHSTSVLFRHGFCLSDVQVPTTRTTRSTAPTTKRATPAGNRVHVIPVFIRERALLPGCLSDGLVKYHEVPEHQACEIDDSVVSASGFRNGCYAAPNGLVEICLMDTDSFQASDDSKRATVELKWLLPQQQAWAKTAKDLDVASAVKKTNLTLAIELIAKHDLQIGDELIVALENDLKQIFPPHWEW